MKRRWRGGNTKREGRYEEAFLCFLKGGDWCEGREDEVDHHTIIRRETPFSPVACPRQPLLHSALIVPHLQLLHHTAAPQTGRARSLNTDIFILQLFAFLTLQSTKDCTETDVKPDTELLIVSVKVVVCSLWIFACFDCNKP